VSLNDLICKIMILEK